MLLYCIPQMLKSAFFKKKNFQTYLKISKKIFVNNVISSAHSWCMLHKNSFGCHSSYMYFTYYLCNNQCVKIQKKVQLRKSALVLNYFFQFNFQLTAVQKITICWIGRKSKIKILFYFFYAITMCGLKEGLNTYYALLSKRKNFNKIGYNQKKIVATLQYFSIFTVL